MKNRGDDNCLGEFIPRLYENVITDISKECGVKATEAQRDVQTIKHRLSCEGYAFVTTVLPQLGKAIGSAFQSGRLMAPSSFHRMTGSQALPSFLQGLTRHVFDIDGALLEDASELHVSGLRQICFLMHKYQRPYTEEQERSTLNKMMQVNTSLPKTIMASDLTLVDRTVLALANSIIREMMEPVDLSQLVPSHGPGSTASGKMSSNMKTAVTLLRDPMFAGYCDLYGRHNVLDCLSDPLSWDAICVLAHAAACGENTATLHLVQKDSGGPRGISCEPVWRMFAQQALRGPMERAATHYTQGRVNFKDQSINQNLALKASLSNDLATIDMKDASDRVALCLVTELFGGTEVLPLMLASRSSKNRYTAQQGDIEFYLNRFAPMGSAMCFPVESIVFWALTVATIYVSQASEDSYQSHDIREDVYTYGDDLILPSKYARLVMDQLERFWLRFNVEKSFLTGPFRESCGCDAFKGVDVTPIKVKTLLPTSLSDTSGVEAWIDYSNAFARKWMWNTSNCIKDYLETLGLTDVTVCSEEVGLIRFHSFSQKYPRVSVPETDRDVKRAKLLDKSNTEQLLQSKVRCRPFYQGRRVKGWSYKDLEVPISNFNEGAGLLDWFLIREGQRRPSKTEFVFRPLTSTTLPTRRKGGSSPIVYWEQPSERSSRGGLIRVGDTPSFFMLTSNEVPRRQVIGKNLKRSSSIYS